MTTDYTLKAIFENVYLPSHPQLARRTIKQNGYVFNRWSRLMADLPADQITEATLIEFRDKCIAEKFAATTISQNVVVILRLMKAAGFALSVNWDDFKLAGSSTKPKLTLEELTRVWLVAPQANWPSPTSTDYRGLKTDALGSAFWWRSLIMLSFTTGLMRDDLFKLRWDRIRQSTIEAVFDEGRRIGPKRLPITEPLRPWLKMLAENRTPTVLGRSYEDSFQRELNRLRKLSGVEHFSLQTIRDLSVRQWEQAGKGCGPLIYRHKTGDRVSLRNTLKLERASHALVYPAEFLNSTRELHGPRMFTDIELPTGGIVARPICQADEPAVSSHSAFTTFFSAAENGPVRFEEMTLRQVFTKSLRDILEAEELSTATTEAYDNAVTHWERLSGNPTVSKITPAVLQKFRKTAKDDTTYSPATVNKWFRYIRALLNHLGPRSTFSQRARSALRIIPEVPYLADIKQDDPNPEHLEEDQINRIYRNCDVAQWPRQSKTGCSPAAWWRSSLVVLINFAARRDDWLYLPSRAISFDKGDVIFKAKKTGKSHALVLNPTVEWHLHRVMNGGEFVFSPTQAHCQLYREWHRIQTAAGVSNTAGEPYGFHDVRATAAARYHEHFPGTAELLLGHALRRDAKVTRQHYLGSKYLKPLHHAIRNIPQPAAFTEGMQSVESITEGMNGRAA